MEIAGHEIPMSYSEARALKAALCSQMISMNEMREALLENATTMSDPTPFLMQAALIAETVERMAERVGAVNAEIELLASMTRREGWVGRPRKIKP